MASLKKVLMAQKRKPWDMPVPRGGWNWPNTWPQPPMWTWPNPGPWQGLYPQMPPLTPRIPFGGSWAHPGTQGDLFIGKTKAPLTGGWVYGLRNWTPGIYSTANPNRLNPYDRSGNVGRA